MRINAAANPRTFPEQARERTEPTGKCFYITANQVIGGAYPSRRAPTGWAHALLNPTGPLAAGELRFSGRDRLFYKGVDGRVYCLVYYP